MDKVEAYSSTKVESSSLLELYKMMLVSPLFEIVINIDVTMWWCVAIVVTTV